MKKIAHWVGLSFMSCLLLTTLSCSNDDDGNGGLPGPDSNIVEIAAGNSDLTSLVAALTAADQLDGVNLIATLSGPGPFTVFAPNNTAFDNLLNELDDYDSLDDFDTEEDLEILTTILTYHVVAGVAAQSGNLSDGGTIATLQGEQITTRLGGGVSIVDATDTAANVVTADVLATNGVVHIIDKVLLPQAIIDALNEAAELRDIVDQALSNPNLSSLVAALTEADLVSTLQGDGPFTVFAPSNDAFATFLATNGFASVADIPDDVLRQVLLNHVVAGSFPSTDLSTGYVSTSATAGPGGTNLSMFINTEGGVTINGISNVETANVTATNGIIHIVDTVIDIPTVVTFAVADPTFSTLVSALTELTPGTDFAGILSRTEGGNGDGLDPDFTVFAPTNDAFAALAAIPEESVLTQVLLHHVVSGNVRSTDLTDGIMPATLEGDMITINLPGTGDNIADVTDGAGNTGIGIIAVDVQAGNGVIHVLNQVLLPDTMN